MKTLKFLISSMIICIFLEVVTVKVCNHFGITTPKSMLIFTINMLLMIVIVFYLGWQFFCQRVPFRRFKIYYWNLVIAGYKMKISWIGNVTAYSWWGVKKKEMENDLKEAEIELISIEFC